MHIHSRNNPAKFHPDQFLNDRALGFFGGGHTNRKKKNKLSKKVKKRSVQAIYGNPSHNYGVSLAVWDHTVLPSTRRKRTHPASTPARQAGTRFTDHLRMEG